MHDDKTFLAGFRRMAGFLLGLAAISRYGCFQEGSSDATAPTSDTVQSEDAVDQGAGSTDGTPRTADTGEASETRLVGTDVITEETLEFVDVPGPVLSQPCDDDDPCTSGDTYDGVACHGTEFACDDGDPCTLDTCKKGIGCTHASLGPSCEAAGCGPCPSAAGFSCADLSGHPTCVRKSSNEVFIPGGNVWFGCNKAVDNLCLAEEMPQRKGYISSFAIDRFEVTVEQFKTCVNAGACTAPYDPAVECQNVPEACDQKTNDKTYPDLLDRPVNYASFEDAQAYCAWSGKASGGQRICTQVEWEKAARGGCAVLGCLEDDDECCKTRPRLYPWGNEAPSCDITSKATGGIEGCGSGDLLAVGSKPLDMSAYGVADMGGNVTERVADFDCSNSNISQFTVDFFCDAETMCPFCARVVKGGSFHAEAAFHFRASTRFTAFSFGSSVLGIRCCHSITDSDLGGPIAGADSDLPHPRVAVQDQGDLSVPPSILQRQYLEPQNAK